MEKNAYKIVLFIMMSLLSYNWKQNHSVWLSFDSIQSIVNNKIYNNVKKANCDIELKHFNFNEILVLMFSEKKNRNTHLVLYKIKYSEIENSSE